MSEMPKRDRENFILRFILCVKVSPSASEFVPVDGLVIWVVLVDAVRPHAADGSPEKALFGSAAREKQRILYVEHLKAPLASPYPSFAPLL